ncbi:hypothetical protein HXY32_00985 [Candidatus Bathyarchaeota archaeon]|nr:hypothetical protein [Candidatus Bathyarchaeota archaeon]
MEKGEGLKLQEIEEAFSRFKICPKCGSKESFWFGAKSSSAYALCKNCGEKFEFHEVYMMTEKGETLKRFKLFRR